MNLLQPSWTHGPVSGWGTWKRNLELWLQAVPMNWRPISQPKFLVFLFIETQTHQFCCWFFQRFVSFDIGLDSDMVKKKLLIWVYYYYSSRKFFLAFEQRNWENVSTHALKNFCKVFARTSCFPTSLFFLSL